MDQQSHQVSPIQEDRKYTREGKTYLEPFAIREEKASKRDKINGIMVFAAENTLEHDS